MLAAKSATPEQIAMYGHVAAHIRSLLKSKGWSIGDLNSALGIPRSNTGSYLWLNGKGAPGAENRKNLAKLSGLKPDDFARRSAKQPKSQEVVRFQPLASPAALTHPKANEVLTFTVLDNGRARIKLDVMLDVNDAMPLMRLLMDAEAVKSTSNTGNPQSGVPSLPRE
jgi:transcriptional regulator with XRE-family HTH domain